MKQIVKDLFQRKKFVGSGLVKASLSFMIAFMLIVGLGFGYILHSIFANYEGIRQIADLNTQLELLESSLINQETGQRGYLLSRRSEFLSPFDRGALNYKDASETLFEQISKIDMDLALENSIVDLVKIGDTWKTKFGDVQIEKTQAGAIVSEKELADAKRQLDLFRSQKDILTQKVEVLRAERRTEMLNHLYILFATMGTLFVVVQVLMLNYLQKGLLRITRPIIQLDRAVVSYEDGNMQERLPDYHEDNEIGRLVDSFRQMNEEMQKEKQALENTYRMINTLHQSRDLEEAYRNVLRSIEMLMSCDRMSIITQNPDGNFSIKAVCFDGMVSLEEQPLTEEATDLEQLVQGGVSTIYEDWSVHRAEGTITEWLYEKFKIRSSMHILLRKDNRIIGVLSLMSQEAGFFNTQKKDRLEVLSPMITTAIENANETYRIQDMAMRDGLTGLWNRRYFEHVFDTQFHQDKWNTEFELGKDSLSMILLDIDHFKNFNDTWGHPEGDLVLKHVAQILQQERRKADIPVRFGGEEFTILLPKTSLEEAAQVAEQLRTRLESQSPSRKYKITASFGVASSSGERSKAELIEAADRALYRAKYEGRNRVCVDQDAEVEL
ncbi:diguanylate cyclase [Saccharibacillus sp. JS10]|uniref:diguanylate cyclase n=1 Tax=Saccharibacillus sp. JS10 TaxID=2950552 RepID=UPI002108C900|nr:diguanylate cyclase [Saccharibacillus sp. JS10]MCQ4086519.1 diguanylate cyclase [Saccharibacillus sp. JS10]